MEQKQHVCHTLIDGNHDEDGHEVVLDDVVALNGHLDDDEVTES